MRQAGSVIRSAWLVILFGLLGTSVQADPRAPAPVPEVAPAPRPAGPWRIGKALGAPAWLRVGLEHRTRVEHLASDFRANPTDDASALVLSTLVTAEVTVGSMIAGLELQDARAHTSSTTPLNTTIVDPLDVLQLYLGVHRTSVLRDDDVLDARLGRISIDLSTRRLVARNRFRNTINAFTGLDARWTSPGKHVARGFVAVPVTRLPSDPEALASNELALDEENRDTLLWSAFYGSPAFATGTQLELYVVGLHERDGALPSRNRQLVTGAVRWFRAPAPGAIDFELEAMPQLGASRATTAPDDVTDLDHRALATHAEIGISPAIAWRPRIALQHDYASGDGDPDDGTMGRFDPLFGARRFDFGPTGIYGPFARANLQSPGLRVAVVPDATLDAFVSYRLCWLAEPRDAWTTAGLRDTTGSSGRFLGEHVEVQLRWSPLPKNLTLEGGAAYLRPGRFARSAPSAPGDPAAYVYTQLTVTI